MEGRTFKHASIDQRDKLDSETTRSEWGGLFREDISQAFPFELVQAASFRGTWNCRAAARHLQIV